MVKTVSLDIYGDIAEPVTAAPNNFKISRRGIQRSVKEGEYDFKITDNLVCIGPIVDFDIGFLPNPSRDMSTLAYFVDEAQAWREREEQSSSKQLATCSGYDRNGAVNFFQQRIKPHEIGSFDLPDADRVWTIKTRSPENGLSKNYNDEFDSYVVLNRDKSTLVCFVAKTVCL